MIRITKNRRNLIL